MKITIKQIRNIIKEELDKLYEEETDSKIKQVLMKMVDDEFIRKHDKKVKEDISTIMQNSLQKMFGEQWQDDQQAAKLFRVVEIDPKSALELLKTFYTDFDDAEKIIINAVDNYAFEGENEVKKQKVIDYINETKNLSGADLAFQDLNEVDLRGFNLSKVFAQHANFYNTDLRGADLTHADLKKAWLLGAIYDDNTKWPARFDFINSGAFGPKANLRSQRRQISNYLNAKNFSGLDLREIDLSELRLRFIDLRNSNLSGAKMKGTDLERAKLNNANLRGVDLTGADLSDAILTGADLSDAILTGARYSGKTIWPEGFVPDDTLKPANDVVKKQE